MLMVLGPLAMTIEAQRRGHRPPRVVVVRPIYSPFYDPFYRSYWRDRYFYQNSRYAAERELAGNERELEKHLAEYRADGVITAKEQRELDDDYKDVRESRERLERYRRYND
jgi:hypothetical protein